MSETYNPNAYMQPGTDQDHIRSIAGMKFDTALGKAVYYGKLGNNAINVINDYGASGNGVIDDYSAINRAMSDISNSGTDVVLFFPKGTYIISSAISLASNIALIGEDGATIKSSSTNIMFQSAAAISNVKISNLKFDKDGDAGNIFNFGHQATDIEFDNCEFTGVASGSNELDFPSPGAVNHSKIKITNCYFHDSSSNNAILIVNPDDLLVENCLFDTCGDFACTSSGANASNIKIRYNDFYDVPFSNMLVRPTGATEIHNVQIIGNKFFDYGDQITPIVDEKGGIIVGEQVSGTLAKITNVSISGNIARGSGGVFIKVGDADLAELKNVVVAGNNFDGRQYANDDYLPDAGYSGIQVVGPDNSSGITVEGNNLRYVWAQGIHVRAPGVKVIGNTLENCLISNSATYDEYGVIYLSPPAYNCVIQGNIIRNVLGTSSGSVIGGIATDLNVNIVNLIVSGNICYDDMENVEYDTGNDATLPIGDVSDVEQQVAQSFTLAGEAAITEVQILLGADNGTPAGAMTVRIETDSSGPTGTLVDAELTIDVDTPTASAWNVFRFTQPVIVAAGTYHVVVSTVAQDTDNYYTLAVDGSTPTYTGGQIYTKAGAGAWSGDAAKDAMFRVYGGGLMKYGIRLGHSGSATLQPENVIISHNILHNLPTDPIIHYQGTQNKHVSIRDNILVDSDIFTSFTDGDTTPSVMGGDDVVYKTANTNPTAITDFDDGIIGQRIHVYVGDANTDFTHGSGLVLQGAANWTTPAAGDMISFHRISATEWVERSRSDNT